MFGFVKVAHIQITVSDAVISIGQCRFVFPFFQADIFPEPVLCLCIVFLVKCDIA